MLKLCPPEKNVTNSNIHQIFVRLLTYYAPGAVEAVSVIGSAVNPR